MAAAPQDSLPKQCGDWADLKAAYRFVNHPNVTPDKIQSTHRQRVRRACQDHSVILAVQDTTELDFTSHKSVTGLGPIGDGGGQGLLKHTTLAVTTDGKLLGILHQIIKPRVPRPEGETRQQRRERAREFSFWPDSVKAVGALSPETRVVHVCDRGGDGFETMHACRNHGTGFLIRARHNRWVQGGRDKLFSFMETQPIVGYRDVPVPARDGRPARVGRLSMRYAWVLLDAPKGDARYKEPFGVWAVKVTEEDAGDGVDPIQWVLLTSEPVESLDQAQRCVDWYGCRWVIEEWHKVEKTGCRLEASQLKSAEAIKCLAALTGVVAVRMLQLRDLAHAASEPDEEPGAGSADQPSALQAVAPRTWLLVVAHLAKCRSQELTPRVFWLTLARRGGFLGRKNDGRPGWETIWRGWYDVMTMVQGIELLEDQSSCETYG